MSNLSKCWLLGACLALLAACTSAPKKPGAASASPFGAPSSRYYQDDGPGDNVPANLDSIPDAVPKREPLNRFANRPYTVLGRDYVPATELRPYREQGIASWYGRKFHNQKTAIGEVYDMYGMTAAHPTLPLPSYARVTSVATGKSVIVRVNDRGPFLHGRVIDLSYAAAQRIGVAQKGSGEVIVEAVIAGDTVIASPLPAVVPTPGPVALGPVAAAAPDPMVQPATTTSGTGGGYVVQLGAFRDNANAQHFVTEARERLGVDAQVRQVGGLWRVFVGPYPERDVARMESERLTAAYGVDTAIAPH